MDEALLAAAPAEGGSAARRGASEGADDAPPRGTPSIGWPIFACWAYFTSASLTTPAMPRFANAIANADGSTAVTPAGVELKGTFESVDQLMTFFFDPVWGAVSDVVGRRPLQVLACAGIAAGWSTVVASRSVPLLLAGRALDGVTSCMLPICQSAVRDISSRRALSARLGVLQGASLGAAFLIGGGAGGALATAASPRLAFAIAAGVAALAGVVLATCAPETLPPARRAPRVDWRSAHPLGAAARLFWWGGRRTRGAALAYLLLWLGLNALQTTLYNYTDYAFGWSPAAAVGLQAAAGLALAASNGLGPRLLLPALRAERNLVRAGMGAFALAMVGMGAARSGAAFAAAVVCASLATFCLPALTGLVAREAAESDGGATLGALEAMSTLDRLLAYKGAARLFAWGLRHGAPTAHFYAGAACAAAGLAAYELLVPRDEAGGGGGGGAAAPAAAVTKRTRAVG